MTTIFLASASKRNNGKFQVFGNYEGAGDRFTFGVRSFDTLHQAEVYAGVLADAHGVDGVERI